MTLQVSWPTANARRLQRHALLRPGASGTDPGETAAVICGAHAQVLSAAELSIALRIEGATRATVRRALWDEYSLIKTYGPRGTVHLLAVDDLPIWTAALSAIPHRSPFPDGVRLTPEQQEKIVAAIGHALEDAEMTIDELDQAVVGRVGAWAGDRVMPAFQELWRDGARLSAWLVTAACCASARTGVVASPTPVPGAGSVDSSLRRKPKPLPR